MSKLPQTMTTWPIAFTCMCACLIGVPSPAASKDPDPSDVAALIDVMTFTDIVTQNSASVNGCSIRAEKRSSISLEFLEFNFGDILLDRGKVVESWTGDVELELVVKRGAAFRWGIEPKNGQAARYAESRSASWRFTEADYDIQDFAELMIRIVAACNE